MKAVQGTENKVYSHDGFQLPLVHAAVTRTPCLLRGPDILPAVPSSLPSVSALLLHSLPSGLTALAPEQLSCFSALSTAAPAACAVRREREREREKYRPRERRLFS